MPKLKAAIFDWAGTMVDFGSFAPMGVFVEAFKTFGIEATIAEARGPMGAPKWDHIKTMITEPRLAAEWQRIKGKPATDADVDEIYKVFVPMNEKVAGKYAILVPGAKEAIDKLRARGMKIGSTTGYTRSIMANVTPVAAEQGYVPDNLVCSDDLKESRPGPLGIYQCMVDLAVYPASTIVKVDDTEPGIGEGVSAGCVTVGVTLSGNHAGKTVEEMAALSEDEKNEIRERASASLKAAGAHYTIDTVADLPALLDRIDP